MQWKNHSDLEGGHAFLSPSNWHWLNDDIPKLQKRYKTSQSAQRGTELHDLACRCIKLRKEIKGRDTFAKYVNDGIRYNMKPEQILFYSYNCFGTADTICYRNRELRIHDLKTGTTHGHFEQLLIYAALFCMEYEVPPEHIKHTELRLYQHDVVQYHEPTGAEIEKVMRTIAEYDVVVNKIRSIDNA